MHSFQVGKLYMPGKTSWPEASYFNYDAAGLTLTIFARNLKDDEIEAVKSGQIELALYENQPAIFLMWKIRGFGPWSDAPYTIHVVPKDRQPDIESRKLVKEGEMLGLQITLVEGTTGIIKVLRYVSTSTQFTILLNEAVDRQLKQPFNEQFYNQHINKLYARYTSDAMATLAEARHKAGER